MGIVTITLPTVGQPDTSEEPLIVTALTALRDALNGNIENVNIKSNAAIDYSKLAALASGQMVVGNGGLPVAVTISGDVTVNSAGVVTIGNSKITTVKIASDAVTQDKIAHGADELALNTATTIASASTWTTINNLSVTAPETGRYHCWGNIVVTNTNASSAVIECQARDVYNLNPGLTFYQEQHYIGATTGLKWSIPWVRYVDLTAGDIVAFQVQVIGAANSSVPASQSYAGINRVS